ncbi:hypothetical protein CRE_01537 [Caenorhabditis remanei]|uniref:F-box domain-containing protein n=1 Tax=Caenorhabditis remanei TaxID=31234 RepID=E3LGB4_CAERE|nr:hypothetical protein CRE_01537 [Caenorhabditis remanei]
MDDRPPLSEIELRTLCLYNIHQWKTAEKTYENYKKVCSYPSKIEKLSAAKFKRLFNQYSKEYLLMSENGFHLPHYCSQICVHSDFVEGISQKRSYEKIREAFKEGAVGKETVEYFYDGFQSRAAAKHLQFSDLPFDTLRLVVKKLDLKSTLNLRNVSRDLRMIVDEQKPSYKNIRIEYFTSSYIIVEFNEQYVLYTADVHLPPIPLTKKIVRSDFKNIAFEDLRFAFRNPEIRLDTLHIRYTALKFEYRLSRFLYSLKYKIHVEHCSIDFGNEKDVKTILQRLKPKVLNKLTLRRVSPDRSAKDNEIHYISFDYVSRMDQWKQVEHVEVEKAKVLSIEKFFHLKRFDIEVESIPMENLRRLINAASHSTNFESCRIYTDEYLDVGFIAAGLRLQPAPWNCDNSHFYEIPETKSVLNFYLSRNMIHIIKK